MNNDEFQQHVLSELRDVNSRLIRLELWTSRAVGVIAGVTAVCTTLACVAGIIVGLI